VSLEDRLKRVRQGLAEKEVDAIFISQPENRRYLSGFDGSTGYLLITAQDAILATDFRYLERARRQAPGYEIFRIDGDTDDWFPKLATEVSVKKLGFETRHVTFYRYKQLSDILKRARIELRLIPVDGLVESLRAIKEPEEVELITQAAAISDVTFEYAEGMIRTGMTEQEVAWEIEKFMRDKGSEAIPFDVIVGSGPNASSPHAKPSSRTIGPGEPIVIDLGAKIEGYCSDLTRTICLGTPDKTFGRVYDTVLGAQLTAMAMIREGMTGDEADSMGRIVLREAGYGEAFGHALGHGVGLAPHERPRLGPDSQDVMASGMVFTIEPGIYLAGMVKYIRSLTTSMSK